MYNLQKIFLIPLWLKMPEVVQSGVISFFKN